MWAQSKIGPGTQKVLAHLRVERNAVKLSQPGFGCVAPWLQANNAAVFHQSSRALASHAYTRAKFTPMYFQLTLNTRTEKFS